MVKVIGISAPAPIPCIARNRISCSILCDMPHNNEPNKKTAAPHMNTGLRPNRSLILPKIGVVIAIASKYEVNIQLSHCIP
ncbi:hypothetical protein D3C78_1537870 [compost metagenome]